MSFEERKKVAAADIRAVAALLEERAKAIEAGDMAVLDKLLDEEWSRWFEMLYIRAAFRESDETEESTETSAEGRQ